MLLNSDRSCTLLPLVELSAVCTCWVPQWYLANMIHSVGSPTNKVKVLQRTWVRLGVVTSWIRTLLAMAGNESLPLCGVPCTLWLLSWHGLPTGGSSPLAVFGTKETSTLLHARGLFLSLVSVDICRECYFLSCWPLKAIDRCLYEWWAHSAKVFAISASDKDTFGFHCKSPVLARRWNVACFP